MIYEERGAIFADPKRTYRTLLWRVWSQRKKNLLIVGINPSAGDAIKDDQTIKKCMALAKHAGYGGIYIVNLFGFVSSQPHVLNTTSNPVGDPENDRCIFKAISECSEVLVAWGDDALTVKGYSGRDQDMIKYLRSVFGNVYCVGKNKSGTPKHPLYCSAKSRLVIF